MSINLENPETLQGKIDAAANFVAQIRLALMIGDKARAQGSVENAERLLAGALDMAENLIQSVNYGMDAALSEKRRLAPSGVGDYLVACGKFEALENIKKLL